MPKQSFYMKLVNLDYKLHLLFAFLIRVVFIIYASYHDEFSNVPYTDVDYKVFSDASRHILNNKSPYERHTYRYTPLIAFLLIPNIIFHHTFGKYLFSLVDIIVALLIRIIVTNSCTIYNIENNAITHDKQIKPAKKIKHKNRNLDNKINTAANVSMMIWLYNPMTIAIATRGNCDSIAALAVLLTQYFLQCRKKYFISGVLHGIAIHIRLYPLIYSLALFMYLSKFSFYSKNWRCASMKTTVRAIENSNKKPCTKIATSNNSKHTANNIVEEKTIFKKEYLLYIIPNVNQLRLVSGCIATIISLTTLFYYLYGYKFLYETYIYHFIRNDTRHNFSIFFYLQYLTAGVYVGIWQKVLILLPQLVLILVFSTRYGLNKFSLNFSLLTQTIVMVAYNTVLTSQYFVWIICVLPLCLWQIQMKIKTAIFLISIWFAAQIAWLLPAYFLEFHGQNTFIFIWMQSVSFFCANIAILGRLIINFMPVSKNKFD